MGGYRTKAEAATISMLKGEVDELRAEVTNAQALAATSVKLAGVMAVLLRKRELISASDARDVQAVVDGTMRALRRQ